MLRNAPAEAVKLPSQNKVLPWSYSSLTAFETCPRRYHITRIAKLVKEPQTTATIHGNEVHKALEDAVSGKAKLAPKYADYSGIVERIREAKGKKLVEQKFALTSSFKPTDFFAPNAWVRGVVDVAIINPTSAVVLDYKTGKVKLDQDQLKLFAATTFALHPYVETVKTGYVWLAFNRIDTKDFSRLDCPSVWDSFLPRVKRLTHALEQDEFLPKPSGLCKSWCPVGKSLCEFCG